MTYQVTLSQDGTTFAVDYKQTILQAAIDVGVRLPYGCNEGLCFGCLQEIDDGEVVYQQELPDIGDLLNYQAMLCKAYATSDVVLNSARLPMLENNLSNNNLSHSVPEKTTPTMPIEDKPMKSPPSLTLIPVKVLSNQLVCDDTRHVTLALPQWVAIDWQAGQYLDIVLDNGLRRSFSIANLKNDDKIIELYIKRVAGGLFTDYVFEYLSLGTIWTVELPLGAFIIPPKKVAEERPLLMLAVSTGIAPLYAMLQQLQAMNTTRQIALYWGQSQREQLYLHDALFSLAESMLNVTYTPVLSRPEQDTWQGHKGYVQEVAIEELGVLDDYDIYISGSPRFVQSASQQCLVAGANAKQLYTDAFTYQGS